jgi:hypothetical protein
VLVLVFFMHLVVALLLTCLQQDGCVPMIKVRLNCYCFCFGVGALACTLWLQCF